MPHGLTTPARRRFLGHGIRLAFLGFSRRLWAQRRRLRFLSLSRPVIVPLATLETPGRARRFVAQGVSPESAANPNQPVRVNGMVVRVAGGDGSLDRDQFKAVCAVCPHEQCEVDFVADPSQLDPLVVAEIGRVDDPVYLCPCHNSVFSMDEGQRLGGPAPRGLYRFRVTDVTDSAVVIGEVEEDVLLFF
jgi:Rieske Fe-S protein